jgi:hypothetical protein
MQKVTSKKKETLASQGSQISQEMLKELEAAGITEVQAYVRRYWDLVCEELCGQGHTTMRGKLIVLEPEEYRRRFGAGSGPTPAPPATQPTVAKAR